jgi:prolyl oligopeptidase
MRTHTASRILSEIRRHLTSGWLFLALGLTLATASALSAGAPDTPKKPVSDTYHGVTVTDDYRWLENWDDPAVRAWTDAQNALTRAYLDSLPVRAPLRNELWRILGAGQVSYYGLRYAGGKLFAMKSLPPHEQPFLVVMESEGDLSKERVLLDLNTLDTNSTTALDFEVPSLDGSRVAVSLSQHGSEHGNVYVYDVGTGRRLDDVVPEVNGPTAGGSVAWAANGEGFYYTHYPHKGERPDADLSFYQQVYYHRLGTPHEEDPYAIGKELPRIAEIKLATPPNGRFLVSEVSNGDGGEYAHYLLDPPTGWQQVTQFADSTRSAQFGPDGALYLLSYKGAPNGRILRLEPGQTDVADAKVIVPESDAAIREFLPTASKLYVVDIVGGPSRVRVFDSDGRASTPWEVAEISSVGGLVALEGDDILFYSSSYTDPGAWYRYRSATGKAERTALAATSLADYSQVEVVRAFATSKDGTRVPMNILRNKGIALDGSHPTLLTGYGGYGLSQSPGFSNSRSIWLNQGGVYVVANLRGGGEFGETWHRTGNLTKKQNVFDDLIACAEYLVEAGYTTPKRLAIEGGSNGGLLMGAALTQRPELFRAVVSHVGIYDMLRVELDPNGEFNTTEYGSVKAPEQFQALYAYSPYHHVKDGTAYPSVFLLTGVYDGRVNPAHSRKMAASLQAATSSGNPILLRTSMDTGHGSGTSLSRVVDRQADVYAFLFHELGMNYRVPEGAGAKEGGR